MKLFATLFIPVALLGCGKATLNKTNDADIVKWAGCLGHVKGNAEFDLSAKGEQRLADYIAANPDTVFELADPTGLPEHMTDRFKELKSASPIRLWKMLNNSFETARKTSASKPYPTPKAMVTEEKKLDQECELLSDHFLPTVHGL